MNRFSVYVHVPYCARKCPYCDFNVHVVRTIPEERYREALLREIDAFADDEIWRGREVATVFFGGGTPSLFRPATYQLLLARLQSRFGVAADAEIAWEANPEDMVSPDADLAGLRSAGITRVSLGAQSFDAELLRTLGRMHAPDDIEQAVSAARGAGFEDIGVDLIFAVPGQLLERWRRDLARVVDLGVTHVSTYGLTYEEGTSLTRRRASGRIAAADEELERAMYETAIETLGGAGYRHYEISNFARPGYESKHNLTYWSWGDYLGLGAGAHGFARGDPNSAMSRHDAEQPTAATSLAPRETPLHEPRNPRHGLRPAPGAWGLRYANVRSPEDYMQRAPHAVSASESLDRSMAIAEFILLGLRRIDGFSEQEFRSTFGVEFAGVAPALPELVRAGLLSRDAGRIALTRQGLLLADSVTARLAATTAE